MGPPVEGKNITVIQRCREFYWIKSKSKNGEVKHYFRKSRFACSLSYYKNEDPKKMTGPVFRSSKVFKTGSMAAPYAIGSSLIDMPWNLSHVEGRITDKYTSSIIGAQRLLTETFSSYANVSTCLHFYNYNAKVKKGSVRIKASGRMCSDDYLQQFKGQTPFWQEAFVSKVYVVNTKRYSNFKEWTMKKGKKVYDKVK